MSERAHVREVGLRDGLQSIAEILPTEQKLAWLDAEYGAGVREIEVSSFVPPKLLPQLADLGWHLQLWVDARDLPAMAPALARIPLPVVVDHMGRLEHHHGTNNAGFQALLRGVGDGKLWAKLSGTYRLGATPPDYAQARPFHDALVKANPKNLVWGTDWPHPRPEGPVPDAARLLQVFLDWTPDRAKRDAILAGNPARLYDFPAT